jgi:hypothetical protein
VHKGRKIVKIREEIVIRIKDKMSKQNLEVLGLDKVASYNNFNVIH